MVRCIWLIENICWIKCRRRSVSLCFFKTEQSGTLRLPLLQFRPRLFCDLWQLRQRSPDWIARTCLRGTLRCACSELRFGRTSASNDKIRESRAAISLSCSCPRASRIQRSPSSENLSRIAWTQAGSRTEQSALTCGEIEGPTASTPSP